MIPAFSFVYNSLRDKRNVYKKIKDALTMQRFTILIDSTRDMDKKDEGEKRHRLFPDGGLYRPGR